MHAYEIPNLRFSLPAGGAVAHRRFVAVANEKAIQATAATPVIGASMNEVTADELAKNERITEIADGIVIVEAGGAVASGARVYADADGRATTTEGAAGAAGTAITAATGAGQLIAVKIN
jgi:hypothetical protein